MPYTEFYVQTTGSNLNAGSTTADTASVTYASGSWVAATGVFTVASGNPASDGVAVGDFASVYNDGSTVSVFIGRVTDRGTTTITISLTAKSGTAPTDGTNNRTLKIGGAWKGPNGAEKFPFGFIQRTLTNSSGDYPRVNINGGTTYNITASLSHGNAGPIVFSGYTTSIGDGGIATIDGGTTGTSYDLIMVTTNEILLENLRVQNNGDSGAQNGFNVTGIKHMLRNCIATDIRRSGFAFGGTVAYCIECLAIRCNQSLTSDRGGFSSLTSANTFVRCVATDNYTNGFVSTAETVMCHCISARNELNGLLVSGTADMTLAMISCDIYDNAADGLDLGNTGICVINIESSNFVQNGGWGINSSGGSARIGAICNCGFGSNVNGVIASGIGATLISDSVNYPSGSTPWNDPDNDDFTIVDANAQGSGRGVFPVVNTIGHPDIGASQSVGTISGGNSFSGTILDRVLEEAIASLIDIEAEDIQCVPDLLAGGEAEAALPRIVVRCESQETPEFQEELALGVYGVYPVRTIIASISEGTSPTSTSQLTAMNRAVDAVMIYNGALAETLTAGDLEVFGVVPEGCTQERSGNRIIRYRSALIWARIRGLEISIVDDSTGAQVVDDSTGAVVIYD